MVGGASPAALAVVAVEGEEVHLLHRVEDEEGEVVLGEPVDDRRREQVELVALGDEEVVGHDVIVAIGPVQVVDLPRATRAFADRLRGSCNRLEWRDITYPGGGMAQVAETTDVSGGDTTERKERRVRLVVRRTRLTDPMQRQLWPDWRHHAFVTNVELPTVDVDRFHRQHATVELAIRDLKEGAGLGVDAEAAHGIELELEHKGGLVVAWDAAQLAALHDLAAAQEGAGVSVQRLEGVDLADVEPHLSAQLAGALFYEDDAQVQPMLAVAHQLARATANGCCMVRGADARGSHDLPRGTRALETTLGSLRVGTAVVNAAGPWAGELAARLGSDLPLAPRRGHVLVTECARHHGPQGLRGRLRRLDPQRRQGMAVLERRGVDAERTMLLCSSRELAGWSTLPNPEIVASITARAISLFSGLAGVRLLRIYVGFRPATPDRLPAIGWDARVPGLLHATGQEGAGISLSLATAEALQCLLEKTAPPVELEPFDPARFSSAEERVTRA